ncbi:hypothetical protein F0562_035842 [Nyssa sinensis]|uniref:WPP domain-containing protein n=1 Tax=Nyssa sinensis TaxID=561372 RepID=A0A5J5AGA0_9ASTE|nr:hypothetical protein F0562_035842 [Nyssa sinensis]
MAADDEENSSTPAPEEEEQSPDNGSNRGTQQQQHEIKKPEKMNTSFSIWPPTQPTRDAVINRLIETLSTPSVLSNRYGSMPDDEASAAARRIEDEALSIASATSSTDDDGIEILQVYSKEISKRMLEAVKSRSTSGFAPDSINAPQSPAVGPTTISPEANLNSKLLTAERLLLELLEETAKWIISAPLLACSHPAIVASSVGRRARQWTALNWVPITSTITANTK